MSSLTRRGFLQTASLAAAGAAMAAEGANESKAHRLRAGGSDDGFDPWIEIDSSAFRSNVREVSRIAGGTPILAVVKNNAYGLGDTIVGPLLDSFDEVAGIACVRVHEAIAQREAGVKKPILNMAETGEAETRELLSWNVRPSLWLPDAGDRMDRIAAKTGRPAPAHLFIDTGMHREGMPYRQALPWIEDLARRSSIRIEGTYQMFVHEIEFDREQLSRFRSALDEARKNGVSLGTIHASPSFEVFHLPEARFDQVRCGTALFGLYPGLGEDVRAMASLKPVFRLCARVVKMARLEPGEGASFGRTYIAEKPTWIAVLPVGHTDGYPSGAANTSRVLIEGKLYPVVAVVSSTHTIVEIGEERTVSIGDRAVLMGPDHPEIDPEAISRQAGIGYYPMMTKMNPLLPRRLV